MRDHFSASLMWLKWLRRLSHLPSSFLRIRRKKSSALISYLKRQHIKTCSHSRKHWFSVGLLLVSSQPERSGVKTGLQSSTHNPCPPPHLPTTHQPAESDFLLLRRSFLLLNGSWQFFIFLLPLSIFFFCWLILLYLAIKCWCPTKQP